MPDEGHMVAQVFIRGRVRHAEDLAQISDAIGFKHLDVHAFGDAVFDPVPADIEPVIGDAAIFYPPVMIRDIPIFRDAEAVRQQIDQTNEPPEEVPAARKPMVDSLDDFRVSHTERFHLQAHGDHCIDMGRICGGINAVCLETVRGIHLPQSRFISHDFCFDIPAFPESQCLPVRFAVFPNGFLHQRIHLPIIRSQAAF